MVRQPGYLTAELCCRGEAAERVHTLPAAFLDRPLTTYWSGPMPRTPARRPVPPNVSGYLVIAVCNFDDIPVALFTLEAEAIAFAKRVRRPRRNPLLSWDITGFIGVKVLAFRKGRPHQLVFHQER